MLQKVRAIDLFCGCGGLSLGFELYQGRVRYDVAMALDNDPQPVKCYNANHPRPPKSIPTARVCDLTWFSHPSEILLYYLLHTALWQPDAKLREALEGPAVGVRTFLSRLRQLDEAFYVRCQTLTEGVALRAAVDAIDSSTFSLAITKAFFARLNLPPLRGGRSSGVTLPWQEEYEALAGKVSARKATDDEELLESIRTVIAAKWDSEVAILKESSQKEGKGQTRGVARRLVPFVTFLEGPQGQELREAWLEWRSRRDGLRATFCTSVESKLNSLYTDDRRVHLLLGGPPCKGFSRVGRAKIASVREQGVHAWANKDYGDERNTLLHKYVLFLHALHPDVFVFENVRHFTSALKTPSKDLDAATLLAEAIEDLSASQLHYEVESQIVYCRQHAVPQDRERFFMVGVSCGVGREGLCQKAFELPRFEDQVPLEAALRGLEKPGEFAFGSGQTSCKTDHRVAAYTLIDPAMPPPHIKYIEWIRQPPPGATARPASTDAHVVRKARPDDQALIEKFAPGQRWMDYKLEKARTLKDLREVLSSTLKVARRGQCPDLPPHEVLAELLDRVNGGLLLRLMMEELDATSVYDGEHHLLSPNYLVKGDDNHGDWFERLRAGRPCKTIVAHIGKDTYGYVHPYEHRAISIREAARVQTFPDFFGFGTVGVVDGYGMIGNAVPPIISGLFAGRLADLHTQQELFGYSPSNGVSNGQPPRRRKRTEEQTLFTLCDEADIA